ncbi:MAG TPA: hypothetical protein VKV23_06925 [Acidimicrobiales bacterium]|jgi:hypothetical protein|nr:hypothetical protein [Acidimicrobiales bacterium]
MTAREEPERDALRGLGRERVLLSLPADARFGALARMCASALASQLGFAVDEIEDLRLAVDELVISTTAGATPQARADLEFVFSDELLEITCTASGVVADDDEEEPDSGDAGILPQRILSERILDALTEAHAIERQSISTRRGWIQVRRTVGDRDARG